MLCKAASLLSALNTLLASTRRTASVSFEEKLLLLWSARPLQSPCGFTNPNWSALTPGHLSKAIRRHACRAERPSRSTNEVHNLLATWARE